MYSDGNERDRLREEVRKAWRGLSNIRATLEEHAPPGTLPPNEFLADFSDEVTTLVAALKHTLANRVQGLSG